MLRFSSVMVAGLPSAWRAVFSPATQMSRATGALFSRAYGSSSKQLPPRVELTSEQKAEIRALRAKDPVANSQQKLAKQFGVSGLYIAMIARAPLAERALSRQAAETKLAASSARHQIAVLRRRRIRELARTPGERGL